MPTEAVEKPMEDTKPEEGSDSGTETNSDDEMPDLEDGDVNQQTSQVYRLLLTSYYSLCTFCLFYMQSK